MHTFVIALAWNPPKSIKPCEVGKKQNPGKLCLGEGSAVCLGGFYSAQDLSTFYPYIPLTLNMCLFISFFLHLVLCFCNDILRDGGQSGKRWASELGRIQQTGTSYS